MRVMIDTNVFISALMFPDSTPAKAVFAVVEKHQLVLCNYIIDELYEKIAQKRPDLIPALTDLLKALDFEIAETSNKMSFEMSDLKDVPIINAAIHGNVDCIISDDKHFLTLNLPRPLTVTPTGFLDKLC